MADVSLIDDGTMDTVFECSDCGRELRYSFEGIERTEDGDLAEGELERVSEEHAEECEPEERHNILCGCGWGRLGQTLAQLESLSECPVCSRGFSAECGWDS